MSVAEFLAWEARQELKYEFDGFVPVAMAGGTLNHARIQAALARSLGNRLNGGPCEFLGSDMKVVMAETVRYPDGQVVCTQRPGRDTATSDPVVLFEVLSDSSHGTDRLDKVREYREIPTVQRYVILEQDRIAATVHVRAGEGWVAHVLFARDTLDLPEIGAAVPLAELYARVELPGEVG